MGNTIKFLKPDLKIAVERVRAEPGDVVIIKPRDRFSRFTDDYIQWLQETVLDVLPAGVRVMILTDDNIEFPVLAPPSGGDEQFAEGWQAAFDALEQFQSSSQSA